MKLNIGNRQKFKKNNYQKRVNGVSKASKQTNVSEYQ